MRFGRQPPRHEGKIPPPGATIAVVNRIKVKTGRSERRGESRPFLAGGRNCQISQLQVSSKNFFESAAIRSTSHRFPRAAADGIGWGRDFFHHGIVFSPQLDRGRRVGGATSRPMEKFGLRRPARPRRAERQTANANALSLPSRSLAAPKK